MLLSIIVFCIALIIPSIFAQQGFINPVQSSGSMLTIVPNVWPPTLGEPLNVILSNNSDPWVLTEEGFTDYMISLNQSESCLGQTLGDAQAANLGSGPVNQTGLLRENYGDLNFGTCRESVEGGNHLRYWNQTETGAIFMAVSVEKNYTLNHEIESYDMGRDWLINNATQEGGTSTDEYQYTTTSTNNTDLLEAGSQDINHDIPIDGVVYVIEVRATQTATSTPEPNTNGAMTISPAFLAGLVFTLITSFTFVNTLS